MAARNNLSLLSLNTSAGRIEAKAHGLAILYYISRDCKKLEEKKSNVDCCAESGFFSDRIDQF